MSLLSVVEDKIRAEPHVFTKFVEILESEPTLRSQAKDLLREYHYGMYVFGIAYCVYLLIDAHCDTVASVVSGHSRGGCPCVIECHSCVIECHGYITCVAKSIVLWAWSWSTSSPCRWPLARLVMRFEASSEI